jgi:uncharacterized protein (TIGR02594 family)
MTFLESLLAKIRGVNVPATLSVTESEVEPMDRDSVDTSALIYRHARKDLGLSETPGNTSTPRIAYAITTAAAWLDDGVRDVDGSIAWCGCIRGIWGIETGTGVPKAHYRAISWLDWGRRVELSEAKRGDTVVISRPGGNHVGLFDHMAGGKVYLLGGNQSNSTTVAPFSVSLVKGVRRGV